MDLDPPGTDPGALLAALAAAAPEVLVLSADPAGRLVEVNGGAEAALGRARAALLGRPLSDLLVVADGASLAGGGPDGLSGPRLLSFVDERGLPFSVRAVVRKSPQGLVLAGVRATGDDGRLGEELVRLNNDLAAAQREAARRGRALERSLEELKRTQALLVHREKMASLGQTTAGVAHEINNPLAYVIANTATLGCDLEDLLGFVRTVVSQLGAIRAGAPAAAEVLERAAGAAELDLLEESMRRKLAANGEGLERIRQIVSDLRTFSRLDEAEKKETDLVASLGATLRFLGPLSREREVALEPDFPRSLRLFCAPGALNQAVSNVVANALQASGRGQSVRVRLLDDGESVRVRVEDDGCGIPEAARDRVFDPFFTTKPVGEGTGLGLAIAHQVVAAHRGRIELESRPGLGTTVTITLPREPGRG